MLCNFVHVLNFFSAIPKHGLNLKIDVQITDIWIKVGNLSRNSFLQVRFIT